jgi:hypothetical protein
MSGRWPYERRIGRRLPVEPVPVTWVLDPVGRGRRRRPTEADGAVVDLSVSGAGVEGPPGFAIGAIVSLRFGNGLSAVRIRRAEPTDRPGRIRYGVQFVELAAGLRSLVEDLIGDGRPSETSWHTAR